MKNDYSMQGLSQILEESDREDFQNARHLLAKLNNQQLINQYVNFNAVFTTFKSKHQLLLAVPINPLYKKFPYQDLQRRELAKRQLSQSMRQFELAQKAILSKQQLGIKVNKKLQEQSERQRLQKSLYEKRHMYFEMLKTSRSFQSEYVHKDSFSKDEKTFRSHPVSYKKDQKSEYKKQSQRKKVDAFVEQTIDDVFLRLQVFGEERDKIKKSWYSWGETCKTADRNKLISEWDKVHQQMKEVLQQLLEKLLAKVSSSELLRQLKIQNISILKSAGKKSTVDKSLRSTRVGNALSKEQTKMIVSFSQWYNKLHLDRRELDFIHVQYR